MEHANEAIKKQLMKFFTMPGEEILLQKKVHVFNLLVPLVIIGLLTLGVSFGLIIAMHYIGISYILLIPTIGTLLTACLFLMGKHITEWNFHWYVITNRKILEVCYAPLGTYFVNDILLDQVKATEIDVRAGGLLNELLDMGDINITFDRPTKQEGFMLHNIRSARQLGMFLTNLLLDGSSKGQVSSPVKKLSWYKSGTLDHKWRFSEDVFPRPST